MPKLQREHDAQAAMLAFRTGLSASNVRGLDRGAKSADAIKAAFLPGGDNKCARSEIEAYALARVKHSQGGSWSEIENFLS